MDRDGGSSCVCRVKLKTGEGVCKCIVFERGGSKGLKESTFLLFLHEGERMGCCTRRGDVFT